MFESATIILLIHFFRDQGKKELVSFPQKGSALHF
jgi:hypothetical protein